MRLCCLYNSHNSDNSMDHYSKNLIIKKGENMMHTMKRLIAAMLTITLSISMTLSNCGNITVFAAEEATEDVEKDEMSVSENNGVNLPTDENQTDVSEMPADSTLVPESETEEENSIQNETSISETTVESELPALHIGHIPKGKELPASEDSDFVYDLPVSFEESDYIILFVNYNLDSIYEQEENGTLVWSILRGEKGMAAGNTVLINKEDDWTGFETVSDSPYFIMTEYENEENDSYKMAELISKDVADNDTYDYYIRAAYYRGTGSNRDEAFYTAATIPFLPQDDAADDTNIDEIQDTMPDTEEDCTDIMQDDIAVTEDSDQEASPETEPIEIEMTEEEHNIDPTPETTADIENTTAAETTAAATAISESTDIQQQTKDIVGVLTVSAENVTLHCNDTFPISATIVPADSSATISWESNNTNIATVDDNGTIQAVAEGTAQITAKCGDMTAAVNVQVIAPDDNEVYDLSGDIWIDGFKKESDDLVYTGQKITQDIRVYHKETLLKEKTDYTLSYKNNVNAAAYNAAKAPSVTITLKGQYQGSVTLYYTILPADISSIDIYNTVENGTDETDTITSGYEQAVTYSKNLKIPNPVLTFGKKNLSINKDFTCDYSTLPADYKKGDSYEAGKVYDYTVNGIGNFTGSIQMHLVIVQDKKLNFSSASVTLGQKRYEYHGTALSKSEVTIDKLKIGNQILDEQLYDYEVYAKEIDGAYVMIYPTTAGKDAGYHGSKKVNLSLIGDRDISDASLGDNWKESITFNQKTLNDAGGIYQAKTGVLTFGTGTETSTLTEDVDYTVKYSNAKKAGTVTVTFTGKGRYKGTLKKKYTIIPNIDKNNFTISWKNVTYDGQTPVVAYIKGGATPDFVLKDQDNNILVNKTDYTVKLKDNKTPGNTMSCVITGKGNYKGYTETVLLKVTTGDISKGTISVTDKAYSTKQNAWKSKVVIKDSNGKTLSAGTDYDKEITYTYDNMNSEPQIGSTVKVTVQGIGCYAGSSITSSYRVYETNISKLRIKIDTKEYTGKEITLSPEDIHVYATSADEKNKNELTESCYEIIEYKNNIKAGTAKVTLRGTGNYGGTKTYSFKIQKKSYQINHVKGITLSAASLTFSLAETQKTLIATITPQNNDEDIANPTVIWSTSNSKIATVKTDSIDGTTITGIITPLKEGSVTITATTQDGNKKAQCKLKIINMPVLKDDGQTITKEVGETYQLEFETNESVEINTDGIVWKSSNSEVVSVSNTGLLTMKKQGAAVIKVSKDSLVQQCYVIVIGDEEIPSGSNVLTYNQPNGSTDDTAGINALLRQSEYSNGKYDTIYIPAGVYWIDTVSDSTKFGGLVLTDNQTLIMSPSALLMAIGNNSKNYQVIWAFGRDNIKISGGQIIGERNEHTGTGGEWGHGISIQGCTNVEISDMDISQCWGDGIYLGGYNGWDENGNSKWMTSSGITITNCNLHHNRRNNLSITDVDNVSIDYCQFNYANGTDPQYGIDIEPNYSNDPCEHITISNSTFIGNKKASMGIITSANDILLENCTLDGNFYNMAGKNVVLRNTTIKGEIVGSVKRE